jgi:amino acid transporter
VLIGAVANTAGDFAPYSFILAAMVAGVTAFSFAELVSRFPVSGGGAMFIHKGFHEPQSTRLAGLMIIMTGVVSAATITRGFVGYVQVFTAVHEAVAIVGMLALLCGLACWGINESVVTAALITFVEVMGLLLIVWVAFWVSPDAAATNLSTTKLEAATDESRFSLAALFSGAFLAFYAYIGFEDMVNVAEEVKNPRRNMPLAIVIAITLAAALYVLVTWSALRVVPAAVLGSSEAPLAMVYEVATGESSYLIVGISLFAVINGALIQIIMGSRICYGLTREGLLLAWLGLLNTKTQTPIIATILITACILLAALWLPIETLARMTTALLLLVFTLVNLALIRIKRGPKPDHELFEVAAWVPVLGLVTSAGFLLGETWNLLAG